MSSTPARRVFVSLLGSSRGAGRANTITSSPCVHHYNPRSRCIRALSSSPMRFQAEPISTARNPGKPSSAPSATNSETSNDPELHSLTDGLRDPPPVLSPDEKQVNWAHSFHGLSKEAFPKEAADVLLEKLDREEVEIKPDGIIYLPEIKYRRILNRAFGPGGWGLAPRSETIVTGKIVTREYGLVVNGRLVSVARGEQAYFEPDGIPTATEGCKSNALMRCCKDLGVASELWDPRYVQKWLKDMSKEVWVEHVVNKKRRKIWIRKDDTARYPFKEVTASTVRS